MDWNDWLAGNFKRIQIKKHQIKNSAPKILVNYNGFYLPKFLSRQITFDLLVKISSGATFNPL